MNLKEKYIFKKVNEPFLISDISAYSEDQILNNNDCNMYVGIDSQYHSKYRCAYFAIVCAYHYGSKFDGDRIGKGIHYVYHDFTDGSTKNKSDRLRKEINYLMGFASYLIYNKGFIDFKLELDFNEEESSFSNKFIEIALNYVMSIGVKSIITKPNTIACRAADNVVKHSFRGKSKVETLKSKIDRSK